MAPTDGFRTRALTLDDAEAGFVLSSEAGWNQTVDDWRMMLRAAKAVGQTDDAGSLVATALVLPYGASIGWIAMVLTTAGHRRLGLATANLRWAIGLCAERGLSAGLDATPAGRPVYLTLGFQDLWPLRRWRAEVMPPAQGEARAPYHEFRPVADADLRALAALDAVAFGANRKSLLAYLRRNRPGQAWLATDSEKIAGFVLGRAGRIAHHVGPLIAADAEVAGILLQRALIGLKGPVSIDVPDHQAAFQRCLRTLGFQPVRPFMRMVRGGSMPERGLEAGFAIAGPELG
jgi:hypothetical protein